MSGLWTMNTLTETLCAVIRDGPAPALWRGWPPEQWARLVAAAHAHGVAGLLQRALAADWPPELPPAARQALQAHVYATAGHNLRAYRALAEVLGALPPGTPVLVLKGAAIGPTLYPALALRPLTDIDLLVPPNAVAAICAALRGRGYRPVPSLAPELARAIEPHVALIGGPAQAVCVEIHWGLLAGSADWRAAPLPWFWQQTAPWPAPQPYLASGGPLAAARQLTPTATLLYQSAHLVLQHGQDPPRLIWIYDLHLLATRAALNWPELVAQAHRLGWGGVVYTALDQARRCFGTVVAPDTLAALRGRLDRRVRFQGVEMSAAALPTYTTGASLMQLATPTRLRMLARLIVPSRAYLRAQYAPRWGRWWPLAYPYRWLKPLGRIVARRPPL